MSTPLDPSMRTARRARERELSKVTTRAALDKGVGGRYGAYLFGGIVALVLLAGAWFAFGDLLTRPATAVGAISVQSSMAGFTPSEIHVKAGSTATLDWWTEDAAVHLQDGVHTMVSPDLGLREALPAESRRTVTWQVPNRPGTYDVYCESCCGGAENPQMHGKIVVEAA